MIEDFQLTAPETERTGFPSGAMCTTSWAMWQRSADLDPAKAMVREAGKGIKTMVYSKYKPAPTVKEVIGLLGLVDSLYSDDSDGLNLVRITDKGSCSHYVTVEVQGVPVDGVIDTGADITIMGGEVFKKVAAVAKLHKSQLKKTDKTPHSYDQTPSTLNGRMDLVSEVVTMCTPYIPRLMLKSSYSSLRESVDNLILFGTILTPDQRVE